jgi:hypothetical protein
MSSLDARQRCLDQQQHERLSIVADWSTSTLSDEDHGLLLWALACCYVQLPLRVSERLSAIDAKLTKAWDALTALPDELTNTDRARSLCELFEHLADLRSQLRRACEAPA